MVTRLVSAPRIDFANLRRELELPTRFPLAAQREADAATAAVSADLATAVAAGTVADRTDIPFVTIDPATSRDLDQAMSLRQHAGGFQVQYAIADVSAYVPVGGHLEAETWQRGETVYLPDGSIPLHPRSLSEDAGSLLPDQVRRAVLWTIDLDRDGAATGVRLERAAVRSRARFDYPAVQAAAAAGRLAEPIAALPALGRLLIQRGLDRGAINLPIPEQEVEPEGHGWRLVLRTSVEAEEWNAQISLLTGMAAAQIMLTGGVGLLRTMPAPRPEAVTRLRTAAAGLGIEWPDGWSVGQVMHRLAPDSPRGAAFVDHAAEILRGAGYTAFDGTPPRQAGHGAVAASYAHVTAPLRRLADRYATEVCLALVAGQEVADWVRAALPRLPEVMANSGRRAATAQRGAIDLAEAVLLAHRVGEEFDAAVLDVDDPGRGDGAAEAAGRRLGGVIAIDEPAVRARCVGVLALGERIRARLIIADPVRRTVVFAASGDQAK